MIALDTSVFMDMFSADKLLFQRAHRYLKEAEEAGGIISTLVLTEVLFHLSRRADSHCAAEAALFIQSIPNLIIKEVTADIAIFAGALRNKYYKNRVKEISYFDCVHLATAINEKAKLFVTTDADFRGITEINVEIYR